VKLVEGLEYPWCIAWLPDGRMLVTEKPGRLRIVSKDFKLDPKPVDGLPPVLYSGQAGLFDIAVHPRYAENGWIYISYVAGGLNAMGTELVRAKLDGYRLVETQPLFRLEPKTNSQQHFGGKIVFDGKGHVYLTLGERGGRMQAQRLDGTIGATVRLNEDGTIPKDNPFVNRKDAKPAIYSYGHRNPQGAAMNAKTGELWLHEHPAPAQVKIFEVVTLNWLLFVRAW
jgi:glucose/arabinose dehydrogenase